MNSKPPILRISFFLIFFCTLTTPRGSGRILTATDGATQAKDLQKDFEAVVNSITYNIYDAFEGSKINTPVEAEMFKIGNKLHIKSSENTISKRLIFDVNDRVTREILLESEKLLRSEQFLADAIIEIVLLENGKADLYVNSFDQFSTAPGMGLQKPAKEWEYWFGVVESNLLGSGQKIGGFYSNTFDRTTVSGIYENKAFLFRNFTLKGGAGNSSDGYNYNYSLGRPLVSKSQKYAYQLSGSGFKRNKYYYLDADLSGYQPGDPGADADKPLVIYQDIVDLDFNASFTKSMGKKNKINLSTIFDRRESYQDGVKPYNILSGLIFPLDYRLDNLVGLSLSFYQSDYKTVKNFRNMKWSEDLDVGFRITNSLYQNIKALGAKNSDLYLKHTLVYINVWNNSHFITTNITTNYFLAYNGEFEDGLVKQYFEYQFKPVPKTSTFLSSSWAHYFAKEQSAQLLLGGEQGLSSYPNRYFAGQARIFMQAEQRYFPDIEIATGVPAFAVFLNAGNAWPAYQDFEWNELHYSTGFGLRLGQTRSVQKVVNHINISFPIDSKYREILPKWRFTILAKANL